MLIKLSKAHLKEAGRSYQDHGWFALKAGVLLLYAGITSIIHGLIPAFFPFLSQKITCNLADASRRGNPPPSA